MTYCVAMRLDAGLVFLADSRTNADVEQISTFGKVTVFEHPGERLKQVLQEIPDPAWRDAKCSSGGPRIETDPTVRAPLPETMQVSARPMGMQLVAGPGGETPARQPSS